MSDITNLILLYGGNSGEHEISLRSAARVLANLDVSRYHVIPIGIDKSGCYYLNDYQALLAHKDSLPVRTAQSKPLMHLMAHGRLAVDADVVFPMVHGPLYEDGCLQGLLELAGVAYVGCDVLSSALGMNKDFSRRLIQQTGIKTARYEVLKSQLTESDKDQLTQRVAERFGWPLFVKPCSLGSSVGIHKVANRKELLMAIDDAFHYDQTILVEEFICGREIELAVLENPLSASEPDVSVAGEICVGHQDGFYSYAAKYLESTQTELRVPARLDEALLKRLKQAASDIFIDLNCQGMARIDFFVNEAANEFYFNEVNTLPGFTEISMFPKLWQASGMTYAMLLDRLVDLARARFERRRQLVTHYQ